MKFSRRNTAVFFTLGLCFSTIIGLVVSCTGFRGKDHVSSREMTGIIDIADLTPTETKRLDELLNREVSPCGEDISLGRSLLANEVCPMSPMALNFIKKMLMDDYDVAEISAAYMLRYAAIKGADIPKDGSPKMGADKPIVTVVVFSDFECPYCEKAAALLKKVVKSYPDQVALVFKNYPLEMHPMAELAARAAFAAHQQGKFWEMHDTLYSVQGTALSKERMETMAVGLGLDMDKYFKDTASVEATSVLEADKLLGSQLGVKGTPTVFVNGRPLDNVTTELEQRIREEFIRYAVRSKKSSLTNKQQ